MAIKPQRDKPLPDGLVHGITSITLESALKPAVRPKPPAKSSANFHQPSSQSHKEVDNEKDTD